MVNPPNPPPPLPSVRQANLQGVPGLAEPRPFSSWLLQTNPHPGPGHTETPYTLQVTRLSAKHQRPGAFCQRAGVSVSLGRSVCLSTAETEETRCCLCFCVGGHRRLFSLFYFFGSDHSAAIFQRCSCAVCRLAQIAEEGSGLVGGVVFVCLFPPRNVTTFCFATPLKRGGVLERRRSTFTDDYYGSSRA